jgi:hypothetical protein
MTSMEHNCLAYNKMILLVALVSICVLGFESVIKFNPEHLSSPQVVSGVRVARSLVFCVMLCGSLFVLFHLAIVLFVLFHLSEIC